MNYLKTIKDELRVRIIEFEVNNSSEKSAIELARQINEKYEGICIYTLEEINRLLNIRDEKEEEELV